MPRSDRYFKERAEALSTSFLAERLKQILEGGKDFERELMLQKGIELLVSAKQGLSHTKTNSENIKFLDYIENLKNQGIAFHYFGIGKEPEEYDRYIDTLKLLKENKPVEELYTNILIGFFDYLEEYSFKEACKYVSPAA
ncbi:MAG: hypothetical protein KKD48_03440 [Nanoarchaeota archaeon]|nr:hypothetical protein [Nanoarchaeota archaeon]